MKPKTFFILLFLILMLVLTIRFARSEADWTRPSFWVATENTITTAYNLVVNGNFTVTGNYINITVTDYNITNNLNVIGNVFASWFYGNFSWITGDNWNWFDGHTLTFNETKLNATIDTKISGIGAGSDNTSWNESRANLLYSPITEPIAVSVNNSWKANYTDWNSSGWIKDWSFQAENQSWNESRANLLYASSSIYISCSGTGMVSTIAGSGSVCTNFNELDPIFSFFWIDQTNKNILSTSLMINSSQNAFFNDFTLSSDETEASFDEYNKPTVTYSKIPGVTGSTTIALFSETPTALNFVSGGTAGNDGGVVLAGNTGSTTAQFINASKLNKFSMRFKDLSAHDRRELWGLFYTLTATDLTSNKTGIFFWQNGTNNANYSACVCNGGRPKTDLSRCECSVSPIQNDTNWHTFEITGNQRYNYSNNSLNTAWTFAIDKDKITNVPVWNKTITPTVTQTPGLVSSLGVWFEPTVNNITNISIDWSYYEFKR